MPIQYDRVLHYDPSTLVLADGTVTSPSLYFVKEISTGMYRPLAGQIGFSILGGKVLTITSSGITNISNSTASATIFGIYAASMASVNSAYINIGVASSTDNSARFGYQHNSTAASRYFSLSFQGQTETIKGYQDGTVVIGKNTKQSWSPGTNNWYGFQIGAGGGFLYNSGTTTLYYNTNAYFDGTNWKKSSTGFTAQISSDGNGWLFSNSSVGGGSAGDNITWQTVFGINTNGVIYTGGVTPYTNGAGDLSVARTGAPTTGLVGFGSGVTYIYYDGTNFMFQRTAGGATLSSNGIITTSHEWLDKDAGIRYKDRDTEINSVFSMDLVRKLNPRTYYMTDERDLGLQVGFFAEELFKISPLLSNGKQFISQHMIAVAVGAIQDVDNRVQDLEKQVKKLELIIGKGV